MKVIINEAQFKKLLEFDDESDQEHADYYRETGFYGKVGSGCIILARNTGRILIPKRSGEVTEPYTWGTWGGAIDIGEDPAYSARREVYEEAGYKGDMQLYPLCVYEKGDIFKYYSYLAVVNNEFRPQLNWETDRADWFDLIDLPSPLHFGLKYILNNRNAINTINKFINIDESIELSVDELSKIIKEAISNIYGFDYYELLDNINNSGIDIDYAKKSLDNKIKTLKKLQKTPSITLYRVVFTKNKEDIDTSNLGLHYVNNLEDFHEEMLEYLYNNASEGNEELGEYDAWLVTIQTPSSNIDYNGTVLTYSLHPLENEILILNDKNIKLINIEPYYE